MRDYCLQLPKHEKCGKTYIPLGRLSRKVNEKESEDAGRVSHCAICEIYAITGTLSKLRNMEFTSYKKLNDFINQDGNLELISTKL